MPSGLMHSGNPSRGMSGPLRAIALLAHRGVGSRGAVAVSGALFSRLSAASTFRARPMRTGEVTCQD